MTKYSHACVLIFENDQSNGKETVINSMTFFETSNILSSTEGSRQVGSNLIIKTVCFLNYIMHSISSRSYDPDIIPNIGVLFLIKQLITENLIFSY